MSFKTLLLGSVAGAAALAMCTVGAPSAMAGPTVTIDGISLPLGFSTGGFTFSTQTLYENVVTAPGQVNVGVGEISLIGPSAGGSTYTYGQNGVYLNFIISGFTVANIVAPTALTAGQVDFTGGTITFYADNSNADLNTTSLLTGTLSALNNAITSNGPDFLDLTAETSTAAGYTIVASLPAGSSTNEFSAIGSTGFFAATGGDAAGSIYPSSFPNGFSPTPVGSSPAGAAAVIFTSSDSTVCGDNAFSSPQITACGTSDPNEFVNGAGQAKFNAIPEPASLGLLGTGLIGFWAAGRRRRSRKSA